MRPYLDSPGSYRTLVFDDDPVYELVIEREDNECRDFYSE